MTPEFNLSSTTHRFKQVISCLVCSSTSGIDQERERDELCRLIEELRDAMDEAEKYEISQNGTEVILCTCIEAGAKRVKRFARISHVVIDEASMCLEAETLVALASAGQKLQQVVLLGDHKQLGAVITCSAPRRLGLGKSLFEVLFDKPVAGKAYSCCMLQTQYRMVCIISIFRELGNPSPPTPPPYMHFFKI